MWFRCQTFQYRETILLFLRILAFTHVHNKSLWRHVYMTVASPSQLSFLCHVSAPKEKTTPSPHSRSHLQFVSRRTRSLQVFIINYTRAKRSPAQRSPVSDLNKKSFGTASPSRAAILCRSADRCSLQHLLLPGPSGFIHGFH